MTRNLILVSSLFVYAGLAIAQHGAGRGVGHVPAGGVPHGGPKQMPAGAAKAAPTATPKTAVTRLQNNAALTARLTPMLPAGMTMEQAAAGFKNTGQLIAALNVSKNLNIPFADLQSRLTAEEPLSLGKAVKDLRPDLPEARVRDTVKTAEAEAKRIEREARAPKH